MLWQQKHHSHMSLYWLGLAGAFLIGRECERMRRMHAAHFAHWQDKPWENNHPRPKDEAKSEEVPSPS